MALALSRGPAGCGSAFGPGVSPVRALLPSGPSGAHCVGRSLWRSPAVSGLRLPAAVRSRGSERVCPWRVPALLLRPLRGRFGVSRALWSVRVLRFPWAFCAVPSSRRWGGGGALGAAALYLAHRRLSALKPSLLLRRWRGIGPQFGRAWDPWSIATMTCVRPWVSRGGRARFGSASCWAFGGVLGESWSTFSSSDYVCGPGLFYPGALHSLTFCPMRSLLSV